MNFVEPEVTPIPSACDSSPTDIMKVIERAYRICYKSEANMKEGSEELISRILHGGEKGRMIHSSPLEHRRIQLLCPDWIATAVKDWQFARNTAFITEYPVFDEGDEYTSKLEGNLRAFFDFVKDCSDVDCERRHIQYVKSIISSELHQVFPLIFKDMCTNGSSDSTKIVKYAGEAKNYMSFHVVTTRDILQEIARHRTISPNVESTRYCNYSKKGMCFCIPRPYEWTDSVDWNSDLSEYINNEMRPYHVTDSGDEKSFVVGNNGVVSESITHHETRVYEEVSASTMIDRADSMKDLYLFMAKVSEDAYNKAISLGCKPQEARMLLLGGLKTEMILTGTYSDWAHFLKLRNDQTAHPQIRYLAVKIENWFNQYFKDLVPVPVDFRAYDHY